MTYQESQDLLANIANNAHECAIMKFNGTYVSYELHNTVDYLFAGISATAYGFVHPKSGLGYGQRNETQAYNDRRIDENLKTLMSDEQINNSGKVEELHLIAVLIMAIKYISLSPTESDKFFYHLCRNKTSIVY